MDKKVKTVGRHSPLILYDGTFIKIKKHFVVVVLAQ